MLHQTYLSVFKTIIDILRGIALASINSKISSSLYQRLFHIKKHSRYPSFQIPRINKGGAFFLKREFCYLWTLIYNASTFNFKLGQHSYGNILNLEGFTMVAMKHAWPCCFHEHVSLQSVFYGDSIAFNQVWMLDVGCDCAMFGWPIFSKHNPSTCEVFLVVWNNMSH
jgi:hypothetical protein